MYFFLCLSSFGFAFEPNDEDDDYRHPPGLPCTLETKSDLASIATKTMFQSSVGHAAVNFLQFEYGCFAPNIPGVMRGSIPNENDRGKIDMQHIQDSLPGLKPSLVQAGAAFALSEFSDDEVFLTDMPPRWLFTEPIAKNALDNFRNNLQHIDEIIDERNKQLEMERKIPYSVLKPSRIPYGIAI